MNEIGQIVQLQLRSKKEWHHKKSLNEEELRRKKHMTFDHLGIMFYCQVMNHADETRFLQVISLFSSLNLQYFELMEEL